jgi:hypothetical protein
MITRIVSVALPVLLLASASVFAAEGKITILAPADGAVVSTRDKVTVSYEADFGPNGNHLHLYLDSRRMDVVRQAKGSDDIRILLAGKHEICLEIETSWHFSTGVRQCITVTAK